MAYTNSLAAWLTFYLFDRHGTCLHYTEWRRPVKAENALHEQRNLFGVLWSLRQLCAALDPSPDNAVQFGQPLLPCQGASFHSYKTRSYKLHYFESPTGIKLVLVTEPSAGDLREIMRHIYSAIYVECVVKDPLYEPGVPFENANFTTALNNVRDINETHTRAQHAI